MTTAVESWDEDLDFQGEFHGFGSSHGAQTAVSSRLSVHSESLVGDDDWNVVLSTTDERAATTQAVNSAKQAGIPIPANIPTSALLGGTIKRLGKKTSKQKIDDDWDNDLDMGNTPLTLKARPIPAPADTPMGEDYDDFDELEGSLGIRFAGRSKDARDSSVSAFSPSMGSATAESDLDEMGGLELPEGPMDFDAMLKKRRAAEAELSDLSQASPAVDQPATMGAHKKFKLVAEDNDDFFNDLDFAGADMLDVQKRTINKNIRVKSTKPSAPATRPATTINFHDKPTDKPMHSRSHLPRPVSGSRPPNSRLEPVFETGASHVPSQRRPLTTTSAQLLRSKRSLPVLTAAPSRTHQTRPAPLYAGSSNVQSPAAAQRAMPYHLRRDSDSNRYGAQSPPPRSHSRLSNSFVPDTPSRNTRSRVNQAPTALAKEAATKRTVTRPTRRQNFGDGSELEVFDDLPTSQQKEAKFTKQPSARGPPKLGIRHAASRSDVRESARRAINVPERMMTPAPPRTPASPTKGFNELQHNTPSYLRGTAASHAREISQSKSMHNLRPRSEGPLMPLSTNWKAQVAARSPQNSPSSQRNKLRRVQPQLIRGNGAHLAKTEKGMIYNPDLMKWEGNENITAFDLPPALKTPTPLGPSETSSYLDRGQGFSGSPPRPALIAPMSAATNLQVNGHMVFDPHQMKWLKLKSSRDVSGPLSPSATDEEEEDPFAGLDDLKDSPAVGTVNVGGMASPMSIPAVGEVHEEFDLGPQFIRVQRDEEANWRKRCEGWFPGGDARPDNGRWRWSIRDMASPEPFSAG